VEAASTHDAVRKAIAFFPDLFQKGLKPMAGTVLRLCPMGGNEILTRVPQSLIGCPVDRLALLAWRVAGIHAELQRGENVNASDETGWTALMIAAAMSQREAVLALLAVRAHADQRNHLGDTALLGAASVRFSSLPAAGETIRYQPLFIIQTAYTELRS
jgi:hypothetical protein